MKWSKRHNLSLAVLAAMAAGTACKKGGSSGSSTTPEETGTGTGTEAVTSVTMSGTLALTASNEADSSKASLTGGTYDLYCVTFTDDPKSCKIPATADAAGTKATFEKECPNYAGAAFGCFLRKDNKTINTVEFAADGGALALAGADDSEKSSTLAVGGGSLVFDTIYDVTTGLVTAKIDKTKSTSLGGGAVAGEKTSMSLTGNWRIKCDESASVLEDATCDVNDPGLMEGFTLYMHQNDDGSKVSMWNTKAARQACFADSENDESNPPFAVKLGDVSHSLDLSSKDKFVASIDTLFGSLEADLKKPIIDSAKGRSHLEWCENAQNPFEDSNCYFQAFPIEEHTWYNVETGQQETSRFPKWPESWEAVQTAGDYTGTAKSDAVKCANEPTPGMPMCPYGTEGDSFTQWMTEDGSPLNLVCKDKNGEGFMAMPATAGTKAEALAAMAGGGNQNEECKEETYAGETMRKGLIDEIRRSTLDLFQSQDHGPGDDSCSRMEIPAGFDFSQCTDQSEKEVCWTVKGMGDQPSWFLTEWKMAMSSDKKVIVANGAFSDQDMPWVDMGTANFLCPVQAQVALPEPTGGPGPGMPDNSAMFAWKTACRTEFVGKSAYDQALALNKMQARWRPIGESLVCTLPAGDPLRDKIEGAQKNSCLARTEYNKTCYEGQCGTSLRCRGSSAGGKCFDDDGSFAGELSGRMDLMNVAMQIGGAFSLSRQSQDIWENWDAESQKPVTCVNARSFTIAAKKDSDDAFKGVVSQAEKFECEGGDDSSGGGGTSGGTSGGDMGGDPGSMPGPTLTQGGDGGGGGGSKDGMTIPISATRED